MLLRPLVPGDQVFVVDVCADPIIVGPAVPAEVPAPAPAMSGIVLVFAILVLMGLALSSIRRRRSTS